MDNIMANPTQSKNTPESELAEDPPPSQNITSPEMPNEGSLDGGSLDEIALDEATPDGAAPDEVVTEPEEIKAENAEENIGLENIHLRINFRIGEISMPVNDLASLTPGFTLTDLPGLTFPRAQAVASGRAFAEGELVEIDGKIGFRITRLLP